jgi:DHA1 family inner membrane transport protein
LRKMDDKLGTNEKESSLGRLFLPSLVTASFASGPIAVLAALLLIDIGNTFNTSVGVAGQINTSYSAVAFVSALLMGVLSIRFNHKSLLLVGLLLIIISAVGCYLALDFPSFLLSYSLSGVGFAVITPMTFAIVGAHVSLKKRASAVGLIVAGGALVYVIGAPVIAVMAGLGGWRFPLFGFVMPVLLLGMLLAFLGLPSSCTNPQNSVSWGTYLQSFREILSNRSAVACLIGDALRSGAFVAIVVYAASFVRERFLASTDLASLVILGGASCYALGSVVSGVLVNKVGRKASTVLTAVISGVFTVAFAFVPIFWVSVLLILIASWFFGMVASAANSLTLEQVPKLRGALMSIDAAAVNLGSALGAAVGGAALIAFYYEGLGSVLGLLSIMGATIVSFLAVDPAKP